jgi:Oxaloacetate decarboxylase, gamma chain.
MTIITLLVVFIALVLLYFVFRVISRTSAKNTQKRRESAVTGTTERATVSDRIPGEVLTAIFMALHEEQSNVHDFEHTILTFNKISKNYSPWSSKFYGLRELPRR